MDARKDRIGEHAAEHAPPWAINALGPVPGHPLDRLDWQRRASSIGAWRELSGYDHPADPIGPEPVAAAPDMRAAWHEALAALGPADGPDVRGMPDGTLLHLRDTYPIETAWAPKWVGDELRQVRAGARDARLAAIRAAAEAAAAQRRGQHQEASRQQELAASYQAMHDAYAEREAAFAAVMADRADWDAATRAQRHLAVAADAELRRRHPGQQYPPLRSAEPPPATQAQRDDLTLTTGEQIRETGQWIKDLAAQRRAFAGRLADRQSLAIPAEDPDYGDLGQAFPPWPAPASGRHPATAQARDPAISADTGTRPRARPGHGSRELTVTSLRDTSYGCRFVNGSAGGPQGLPHDGPVYLAAITESELFACCCATGRRRIRAAVGSAVDIVIPHSDRPARSAWLECLALLGSRGRGFGVGSSYAVRAGLRGEPVRHPHAPMPIIWTGRRGRAVRMRSPNVRSATPAANA